jgi:hypothetical protein
MRWTRTTLCRAGSHLTSRRSLPPHSLQHAVFAVRSARRVYAHSSLSLSTGRARQRNRLGRVRSALLTVRPERPVNGHSRALRAATSHGARRGACRVPRRAPRVVPGGRADDSAEDYEQAAALPDRLSSAAQARAARADAEEGALRTGGHCWADVAWSAGMLLDAW